MKRPSLQRRLLWFVGLPVVALWLGAGLWLAQGARHESAEMFDRELERTAASVLAVIASMPDAALIQRDRLDVLEDDDEGPRPEIVVRDRNRRVLLDASSLPPLDVDHGEAHFHTLQHDGETWRVHQRWDTARRHWIQVAAPLHDRDELLWALAQATLVPLLGLLVLLVIGACGMVYVFVRSITSPMQHAVRLARAVAEGDLTVPCPPHGRNETGQLLSALAAMQQQLASLGLPADYLQLVAAQFQRAHPEVPTWTQSRGMDEAERNAFIARFAPPIRRSIARPGAGC